MMCDRVGSTEQPEPHIAVPDWVGFVECPHALTGFCHPVMAPPKVSATEVCVESKESAVP